MLLILQPSAKAPIGECTMLAASFYSARVARE